VGGDCEEGDFGGEFRKGDLYGKKMKKFTEGLIIYIFKFRLFAGGGGRVV
jgi:hypothetical protein